MKTKESHAVVNGTATASDLLRVMLSDMAFAQANETLLSSLTLINQTGLPRSIMICSTQPQEGKTTLATMLALTAARAEKQVLLVDADLRRPRIHQIFGRDNQVGFGDFLAGTKSLGDSMSRLLVASERPPAEVRLHVMSSGGRRSVDFNRVGRERFAEVVNQMTAQFDIAIIDCPPVLAVSDALFLASAVEGVVFAVDAGAVSRHQAKLAKARLEKAGAKLLGFVMNRLNEKRHGISYHPYHPYYSPRER